MAFERTSTMATDTRQSIEDFHTSILFNDESPAAIDALYKRSSLLPVAIIASYLERLSLSRERVRSSPCRSRYSDRCFADQELALCRKTVLRDRVVPGVRMLQQDCRKRLPTVDTVPCSR